MLPGGVSLSVENCCQRLQEYSSPQCNDDAFAMKYHQSLSTQMSAITSGCPLLPLEIYPL